MKRKRRDFEAECARRLRKAYDRMRLLEGVESADLNALIDTWEYLEARVRKFDRAVAANHRAVYFGGSSHGAYRDRGGVDLP